MVEKCDASRLRSMSSVLLDRMCNAARNPAGPRFGAPTPRLRSQPSCASVGRWDRVGGGMRCGCGTGRVKLWNVLLGGRDGP